MKEMRLYSIRDTAVGAYLPPFWSDHKANALRSVSRLVNETSNPDNMVAAHPDQFVLFEIGIFDTSSGVFLSHSSPMSLGNLVEFVHKVA